MKWNQKAGAWEVSLRLHPQDLEAAMTSDLFRNDPSKKVSAEDRNFPELAQKYLSQCFFIRRTAFAMSLEETTAALNDERSSDSTSNQAGEIPADRSTLKWVGTEQEKGWLWIHFEMKPPETKKGTINCGSCIESFWSTLYVKKTRSPLIQQSAQNLHCNSKKVKTSEK